MTVTASATARYEFAIDLIRDAGDLAHGYFKNRAALTITSKGVQDMVSEADLNTELLIRERLKEAFPDDAFLGEETGISEYRADQGIWVVDPIDGTQPFVSGLSNWCVSIAYVRNDAVEFGMVYAPERAEMFAGGLALPSTLNGAAIAGHAGQSVREGMVGVGYSLRIMPEEFLPKFERFLRSGGMFYRDGSGALMLCYVACGRLLGYVEPHINAWDCLGAIGVLQGAGLKTNDFLANDGLRKGNPIYAGNAAVCAELENLFGD